MSTAKIFTSQWPKSLLPTTYSEPKKSAWNLITSFSGANYIHNKLAPSINPAIVKDPAKAAEWDALRVELFRSDGQYKAQLIQLNAPDGTLLKGAFFKGTSNKAILFALGAGGRFESIANTKDAAHVLSNFFGEN